MEKAKLLIQKAKEQIAKYHQQMIDLNLHLADNPEISGQEYNTVEYIKQTLESDEVTVTTNFSNIPTSFLATKDQKPRKYKIAVLTEYDALPKLGHACAHNVSCAISLLAGLSLLDLQDELDANIDIVGTPVEETDGAKCQMADAGVFDNYDIAIMIHLNDTNIIAPKLVCLSSYKYNFYGKSAHSSDAPWEGKNALNGAQLFMHAVDMLRQHVKRDVQLHGIYRDGGAAPNIVPDKATIELYIRAETKATLEETILKVANCAKGAAIATETTHDIEKSANMYLDLKSAPTGESLLNKIYNDLNLELEPNPKSFGSSDAGNVSHHCPTFHPTLSIAQKGTPLHTTEFEQATRTELAQKQIAVGAEIISRFVIEALTDEVIIQNIKEDSK